jgi:hypothetical protein
VTLSGNWRARVTETAQLDSIGVERGNLDAIDHPG